MSGCKMDWLRRHIPQRKNRRGTGPVPVKRPSIPQAVVPLLCGTALALSLTACGSPGTNRQEAICTYVLDNQDTLLALCETWCQEGEVNLAELGETDVIQKVELKTTQDDHLILFESYMEGIVTSSITGGFYYSEQDEFIRVVSWVPNVDPIVSEDRWEWCQSDDYCIVKKICDHFYLYTAGN